MNSPYPERAEVDGVLSPADRAASERGYDLLGEGNNRFSELTPTISTLAGYARSCFRPNTSKEYTDL
jgi:hypothetical protein